MQRLVRNVGYATLVVTPAALLARALLLPGDVPTATLGLGGGVAVVGGVTAVVEREGAFHGLDGSVLDRSDAPSVLAVVAAAGVTYALSVHAGLGPVAASALVGVAAGLAVPEVDTAAYCGSFVGMATPPTFPSVEAVLVAGLVAGIAFVAARGTFSGFGGKLGTLALFGCATTALLTGVDATVTAPLHWHSAALVVPVAVAGAVATVVLSVHAGLGAVLGSALVGLVAALALPVALPAVGNRLTAVAFCSSFVGMSTTGRLGGVVGVGAAGALSGVVFVAVSPAFVGFGGKLGTVAFVACVACFGAGKLRNALASRT